MRWQASVSSREESSPQRSARPGARARRRSGRWPRCTAAPAAAGGMIAAARHRRRPVAEGLARFEARAVHRRDAGGSVSLHDDLRDTGTEAWVDALGAGSVAAVDTLHATVGVVASLVGDQRPLPGLVAAAVGGGLDRVGGLRPARGCCGWRSRGGQHQERAVGAGEGGVTLLIAAPYSAPRGGFRRRRSRAAAVGGGALLLVAVCAGLRALDLRRAVARLLQFVPTVALLLALAASRDAAVADHVPGRAAPGGHGRAPRRAAPQPARPPRPALLLHGALRAYLRREKPDRRTTVLLELGPGSGYTSSHPKLRAAAETAGPASRCSGPASDGCPRCGSALIPRRGDAGCGARVVDAIDAELP